MKTKEQKKLEEAEARLSNIEMLYRVGNHVRFTDGTQDVVKTIDSVEHTINGRPTGTVKPIELTDEWLKLYGFKLMERELSYDLWRRSHEPGSRSKFDLKHYINGYEHSFGNVKHTFSCVHSLQNIFRSATYCELIEAPIIKGKNGTEDTYETI